MHGRAVSLDSTVCVVRVFGCFDFEHGIGCVCVCVCVCVRVKYGCFSFVCLFTCSLRVRQSSVCVSRCIVYCHWRGPVRARRGDVFLALRCFIGAVIPL